MTVSYDEHNYRDLNLLSYYCNDIASTASVLSYSTGISSSVLEAFIAAPIVEEFHDRSENLLGTATQAAADNYLRKL